MDTYGFILTRHVNSSKTNKYWNTSVRCLRRLYPFIKIVIIDDNSNYDFVSDEYEYKNVTIINSEFKGRGELLPYYYYLKNKWFNNAVILHDSVFIHSKINFHKLNGIEVLPLWHFNPDKENMNNTLNIINSLDNNLQIKKKIYDEFITKFLITNDDKWYGCFGVQTFINHGFLQRIELKYKITNLINVVLTRADRCCLERILGCLFYTESSKCYKIKSLFGNIMTYDKRVKFNYSYDNYESDIKNNKLPKTVIKVWTGR